MAYRGIKMIDPFSTKTSRNERFAQMTKQEQLIEQKKREIQAKLNEQKQKSTEEALRKMHHSGGGTKSTLSNKSGQNTPNPGEKQSLGRKPSWKSGHDKWKKESPTTSASNSSTDPSMALNAFVNDGSFLDQFKKISGVKETRGKHEEEATCMSVINSQPSSSSLKCNSDTDWGIWDSSQARGEANHPSLSQVEKGFYSDRENLQNSERLGTSIWYHNTLHIGASTSRVESCNAAVGVWNEARPMPDMCQKLDGIQVRRVERPASPYSPSHIATDDLVPLPMSSSLPTQTSTMPTQSIPTEHYILTDVVTPQSAIPVSVMSQTPALPCPPQSSHPLSATVMSGPPPTTMLLTSSIRAPVPPPGSAPVAPPPTVRLHVGPAMHGAVAPLVNAAVPLSGTIPCVQAPPQPPTVVPLPQPALSQPFGYSAPEPAAAHTAVNINALQAQPASLIGMQMLGTSLAGPTVTINPASTTVACFPAQAVAASLVTEVSPPVVTSVAPAMPDQITPAATQLAQMVAEGGDEIEEMARQRNQDDPAMSFLYQKESPMYLQYRSLVERLRDKREKDEARGKQEYTKREEKQSTSEDDESSRHSEASGKRSGDESDRGEKSRTKRKRCSRWEPEDKKVNLGPVEVVSPQSLAKSTGASGTAILTKVTRTDPNLLQYARNQYGRIDLSEEDWKKCEEHYKIHLLYQDMLRKRQEIERLARAGKFKYEYDSDEEVEGGTWEHKLRMQEMEATQLWAEELTKKAEGKHHIGDFLPPEELEKFMEKWNALKEGREPDLSDYKEYKLREDNIGFQLLQKMGWTEGQGLGADSQGIVDPVNKATQRPDNQGLGMERPADVSKEDDEYEAYRKRMMLAYRFRPNPLNNPRRPYY